MAPKSIKPKDISPLPEHSEYVTIKQFCSSNVWPTEQAVRAIRFDCLRGKNPSFKNAFATIGRRVLVRPAEFWRVLKEISDQRRLDEGNSPRQD